MRYRGTKIKYTNAKKIYIKLYDNRIKLYKTLKILGFFADKGPEGMSEKQLVWVFESHDSLVYAYE